MRKLIGITLAVAALAVGSMTFGHPATERYIPIGMSPGISGKVTVIGAVQAVNVAEETVQLRTGQRSTGFACNDQTKFWLDRSSIRKTNLPGTLADCEEGRRVEVRYVNDDAAAGVAAWVKIEIGE